MKYLIFSLILALPYQVLASSSSSPEEDQGSWNSSMQELRDLVEELIPAVFSESEFQRVKDSEKFKKNLEKFSKISHSVKVKSEHAGTAPVLDPSLRFVSTMLEDNAKRAFEAYQMGQKEWAQGLVKQSLGFCFSCHSTDRFGPRFDAGENPKFLKGLSDLDKADYFAATRHFDQAFDLYKSSVESEKLATNLPFEWQRAVRNAIAMAVRVKGDAKVAESIVTLASQSKAGVTPVYLDQLKSWKQGLGTWRIEQKRFLDPSNEATHLERLQWLATQAKKRKSFDADRSAEIEYLRLSALAHEFLKRYPDSKKTAEVLYQLGVAYDALRGLGGLWMLQDAYWEACIYSQPNSNISWKCYEAYRDSLYRGYAGSRGVDLPIGLTLKLHELKKFANP